MEAKVQLLESVLKGKVEEVKTSKQLNLHMAKELVTMRVQLTQLGRELAKQAEKDSSPENKAGEVKHSGGEKDAGDASGEFFKKLSTKMGEMELKLDNLAKNSQKQAEITDEMDTVLLRIYKEQEQRAKFEQSMARFMKHETWVLSRVMFINGKVQIYTGERMSVDEWEKKSKQPLWKVFPDLYEVNCVDCRTTNTVLVREDGVSVQCRRCRSSTPLGQKKEGCEWMWFSPCQHFSQIPRGSSPNHCGFCGKVTSGRFIRTNNIPAKKKS